MNKSSGNGQVDLLASMNAAEHERDDAAARDDGAQSSDDE